MDRATYKIWIEEAKNDYYAGKIMGSFIVRKYNLAIFNYIQAAEKALKALLYLLSARPWGHSHSNLLTLYENLGHKVEPELKTLAKQLEQHYLISRYPDASPNLSPKDMYTRKDAQKIQKQSEQILDFVEIEQRGQLK